MLKFGKTPRIRSKKHLDFIRGLPCLKCAGYNNMYHNEAAHIRVNCFAGIALKSGDNFTVPLCGMHHHIQHQKGERTFWGDKLDTAIELAQNLYRVSGDRKAAISLIREAKL